MDSSFAATVILAFIIYGIMKYVEKAYRSTVYIINRWKKESFNKELKSCDLYSISDITCNPHTYFRLETGVKIQIRSPIIGLFYSDKQLIKAGIFITQKTLTAENDEEIDIFGWNASENQFVIKKGASIGKIHFLSIQDVTTLESRIV
jgi:dUTPase